MCDRWRSFGLFLADVGEKPDRSFTLERIDNSRGYEPGNCRWATRREQGNNRITNVVVDYHGTPLTLAELARATGSSKEIIRSRLSRSEYPWTTELAVKIRRRMWRGEVTRLFANLPRYSCAGCHADDLLPSEGMSPCRHCGLPYTAWDHAAEAVISEYL